MMESLQIFSITENKPVWHRIDSLLMSGYKSIDSIQQNDSIGQNENLTIKCESLFSTEKNIEVLNGGKEIKLDPNSNWLFGVFSVLLLTIVLQKVIFPGKVNKMLKTMLFPWGRGADARVFDFHFDLFSVSFMLIYSLAMSLCFISATTKFNLFPNLIIGDTTYPVLFALILASLLVVSSVKLGVIRISGLIFTTDDVALKYQDLFLVSLFSSATFIIPLLVADAFADSLFFIIAALLFLSLFTFIRLVRSILLNYRLAGYSLFHFILYFCTLEILPIIAAVKLFMLNANWLNISLM